MKLHIECYHFLLIKTSATIILNYLELEMCKIKPVRINGKSLSNHWMANLLWLVFCSSAEDNARR